MQQVGAIRLRRHYITPSFQEPDCIYSEVWKTYLYFLLSFVQFSINPILSSDQYETNPFQPTVKYLPSKKQQTISMSGLLGNDKKQQEGGVADGATGVAKTGTGSEFIRISI